MSKTNNSSAKASAEAQLKSFISKFEPEHQKLIRAVRRALRARFPTAFELVYDNYNFFVIGYSPTERPSEAIVSIAAGANGVNLVLLHGARLPDPEKITVGSGKQVRSVRIESPAVLMRPAVKALLSAAESRMSEPFAVRGGGKLIIRSVSAKQRSRTKAKSARE